MNSKQYVIFLLCLLLFSMVWPLYSGEAAKRDLQNYIVQIDYLGQVSIRPPDGPVLGQQTEDQHTHEESLQDDENDRQEYHDQPEKQNDSNGGTGSSVPHFSNYPSLWQTMLIDGGKIAAGSCLFTGVVLFMLDRVVEQSVINEVLAKYGKTVSTISSNDAKLMHMAYRIDEDGLHTLMNQMIAKHGNRAFVARKRAWVIPALTELYFDAQATPEAIGEFIKLVGLNN